MLAVLYPAMDGRGVITIPGYRNERVEAVDGFYVIAGHNPGVHGAILTEALASRFGVHIEVTTDWELARHLGVPAAAVNAAVALNADLAAGKPLPRRWPTWPASHPKTTDPRSSPRSPSTSAPTSPR